MYIAISTIADPNHYYGKYGIINKTMYFFETLINANAFAKMHQEKYIVIEIDNGSMLEISTLDKGETDYYLSNSTGTPLDSF